MAKYHKVVQELVNLIKKNSWEKKFNQAIKNAHKKHIPQIMQIKNLNDYLDFINNFLTWVPTENETGKAAYDHIWEFYFILDQSPVKELQNKIIPHDKAPKLTPLSAWMVKYAKALGTFLDTPESLTPVSIKSFYASPNYNMDEYLRPNGDWKTFNEFFARHFKPGTRPIAAVNDQTVIVSPADSTFGGRWEILPNSGVTIKGLHWEIEELLEGSPFKDRFTGGIFMHAFLNTTDYHRQHAPVGGKVLESRFIPGQVYLQVVAEPVTGATDGDQCQHRLSPVRQFDAPDDAGYQFAQARGLVVLDTPIGLVAVLPIGMAQVSSVILTAEVGVTLRKGEEISYFQFGGSDIIVLFEASSNVNLTAQVGNHHKVGTKIGEAYPVL